MELQCCGSVIEHQEGENITNYRSSFPDKKPSILGREHNTDVWIPLIQAITPNPGDAGPTGDLQDHIILNGEPSYLGRGMQEGKNIINYRPGFPDKKRSFLGRERNTDVRIPLIQVTTSNAGDDYWIGYDEQELKSALSPNLRDKEPSHIGKGHSTYVGYSITKVSPKNQATLTWLNTTQTKIRNLDT